MFKELKKICVAGVRKPWENVSINLDKVYKNALQAAKKYTNIENNYIFNIA